MNNTQSSAQQGQQLESVPQISTFQFDKDSIGKIKSSVNLFRGTVNLPLNLISLPGLKDLDVNFMLLYGSNVKSTVENWNLTHPTGCVGMGWEMIVDKIVVNKHNSGAPDSDQYYLISGGSANQLIQTGINTQGALTFQLRNYEFWDVQYFPNKELWQIIYEDGTVNIYGNKTTAENSIEYGVNWGNWMGDSALTLGQKQYAVAWNLSERRNLWGSSVKYDYEQEVQHVGSSASGKRFTQASYLKQITDSLNRQLIFNYKDKYGAKNSGPGGITEYQAANTKNPAPNAYQDTYETKFLDNLEVKNASGSKLFSFHFDYDFVNTGSSSDPALNLLYKRVLTKIWQVSSEGRELPGFEFTYFDKSTDTAPGSINSVTFPYGGQAKYNYKKQNLTTSRNLKIANPITGATPRVWFGPDYSVVTWYNASTKKMKAEIYSWSGTWTIRQLSADISTVGPFNNVDFDLETLGVITEQDFIVIYFTNKATNSQEMYFYRRSMEKFGTFDLKKGPERISLNTGAGPTSVISGDNFVVAANKDFKNQPFYGYQWNWKNRTWEQKMQLPSFSDAKSADSISINARGNYYIVCFYSDSKKNAKFQLIHHDGADNWKNPTNWNESFGVYKDIQNPAVFPFVFNVADSFAAATYITAIDHTNISYDIRIFQWDSSYFVLNPGNSVVNKYTSPIVNKESLFSVMQTFNNGSLLGNNPYLNRYIGGSDNSSNPLNWLTKPFAFSKSNQYKFAFSNDVAVMSEDANGSISNKYFQFNPNSPNSGGWGSPQSLGSSGKNPTVLNDYLTAGPDVFYRKTDGNWNKLSQKLINLSAPETVRNRAPEFIVYQDNTNNNAQTYITYTKNGRIETPVKVTLPSGAAGQKVHVEQDSVKPGTILAGINTFLTYPTDQKFDNATYLTIYRVENGMVTGDLEVSAVASVNIENEFDPTASFWQSYDYTGSSTSRITYDAINDLPQFPQVRVIPNTKSPADTIRPNGSVINYYSNGVSEQSALPYSLNWSYNYSHLLNGTLLGKKTIDSKGAEVASEVNYFTILQKSPNGDYLFSAYTRKTKTTQIQDGVTKTISSDYYVSTGQLKSTDFNYYDSEGNRKNLLIEKIYAIQIPEYQAAMSKLNILDNVAQEIITVTDVGSGVKSVISSGVNTWRNWDKSGGNKWAPFQKYQWEGPADGTPEFDFSPNGNRDGWLHLSEVKSRREETGHIVEQTNVDGMPTSYLYDKNGINQIAEFPNAGLQNNEAGYYSFEAIESPQNWQLGSGAAIIPNNSYTTVDAHTGSKSLMIASQTTSGNGIKSLFTPDSANNDIYIFSCFFKKPDDFNISDGNARWSFTFEQGGNPVGSEITLDFPDVNGSWNYIYTALDLSEFDPRTKGAVTISIEATNNNNSKFILIDNLRFSPLDCVIGASNISTKTGMIDAYLGANGETRRILYDDFQQAIAATGNTDETSEMMTFFYSRTGNNGKFNPSEPNTILTVNAARGGAMSLFNRGEEFRKVWTPGTSGNWAIEDEKLVWSSTSEGTLTLSDNGCVNKYGLSTAVTTDAPPTKPLGVKIGASYTIQYDPAADEWQLLDGNAGTVIETKSSANKARGKTFHRLNTIAEKAKSNDPNSYGTHWILLVGKHSILFFVEGKQLFGYVSGQEISGVPEIFLSDPGKISYLVNSRDNRVNQTYLNGSATDQQSQLLFDTQVSAVHNVYDTLGRAAIHTKPAFLSPDNSHELLFYREDLAAYDWKTGAMSGLIQQIYPDDGGFPYFQERYENSLLERVVEQAMPGQPWSIGNHTLKIKYGTNDGSLGLPANQFFKETQTDQNGDVAFSITDQRGSEIYKVSQKGDIGNDVIKSFNKLDVFGNPVEQRPPNYYSPPAGSTANDWIVSNTFNYAGRTIQSTTSDAGTQKLIYDSAGRVRFRQDAQGSSDSNYQYFKYDFQGRLIEMGYINGIWDEQHLTTKAKDDSSYPPTPDTWRKKFSFSGNGDKSGQVGRLIKVEVNSANNGQSTGTEQYSYDVGGNILSKVWGAAKIGGELYTMAYDYNSLGEITLINYPTASGNVPMTVSYGYNEIGQIRGVGSSPQNHDDIAKYTYNATGKPETEILNSSGTMPVYREFSYNSPVWLDKIKATVAGQSSAMFEETLNFEAKSSNETTYYNGQLSSWGFDYQTGASNFQDTMSCKYNALGALTSLESSSTGKQKLYSYDENNNFKLVQKEGKSYEFVYNANNSVNSLKDPTDSSVYAQYLYDFNGNITQATDKADGTNVSRQLKFNYDPGILLTASIDDLLNAGNSYGFEYDGMNQRVTKEIFQAGVCQKTKVYVRGLNTSPLMTFFSDEANSVSQAEYIIYGPLGMLASTDLTDTKFLIRDHLNSTRIVIDDASAILASYNYDVFGTLQALYESAADLCSYLYTGQEWDAEYALYNFRSRFYFSDIGRFAATDPGRQFYSPYVYAGNNPLNFIDPSGNFSIGNFFSAIAGAIIGAIEILIGVVVDIVAGVLEVISGGLATPVAVGLAALSGFFYGAGVNALAYSTVGLITNEFSWKDYGINMGVGAVTGAIGSGFSALGSAFEASAAASIKIATESGEAVSRIARVANVAAKPAFQIAGSAVSGTTGTFLNNAAYGKSLDTGLGEAFIKGAISGTLSWAIPAPSYKAGWKAFGIRTAAGIAKSEGIGITMQVATNAAKGDPLQTGMLNTIVKGAISGAKGGIGAKDAAKQETKDYKDAIASITL